MSNYLRLLQRVGVGASRCSR